MTCLWLRLLVPAEPDLQVPAVLPTGPGTVLGRSQDTPSWNAAALSNLTVGLVGQEGETVLDGELRK